MLAVYNVHTCTHAQMHIHIHTCTYAHMHIHSHNFIHANVHYLIASTTCTYAHMHTYTYTHIHMHTYGQFPAVSGMDSEVGPFRAETGYENKEGEVRMCVCMIAI